MHVLVVYDRSLIEIGLYENKQGGSHSDNQTLNQYPESDSQTNSRLKADSRQRLSLADSSKSSILYESKPG